MRILRNYAFVLTLALTVVYVYAPLRLEDLAKPRWFDNIGVIIKSLVLARREASVSPVDPVAAANVDEDLDYRIAQRTESAEGWRSFLAAHPDGPHAQSARAALDKLVPTETAPARVQATDAGSPDGKIPSDVAPSGPSLPETAAATPASDETCRGDEDRLAQLSNSPTGDGVIPFLIELRCEKLRPQLLRLAERLDDKAPAAAADAAQGPDSSVSPGSGVSTTAPSLPPRRATEPRDRPRPRVASRGSHPRRHATSSRGPRLPPILMALFGERPSRTSTAVRRVRVNSDPGIAGAR